MYLQIWKDELGEEQKLQTKEGSQVVRGAKFQRQLKGHKDMGELGRFGGHGEALSPAEM